MSQTILKQSILKGTFILTAAGLITRLIGFYYRIFLASAIGAEGVGLYQMIFPVYTLCISFAVTGIQTAISKYTAEQTGKNTPENAILVLFSGLRISGVLSILTALILYFFTKPVAIYLAGDIRCEALLKIAAVCIPICAVHGCIIGYFMGKQNATIPAVAQFFEQCVRVGTVVLLSFYVLKPSLLTAKEAMLGVAAGESASTLICLFALNKEQSDDKDKKNPAHPYTSKATAFLHDDHRLSKFDSLLLRMSFPLTLGRVLTGLLLSSEAFLIINGLRKCGISQKEALETYGVLSGMAMPFLFFPSTLTQSLSSMLLPSVSAAQAAKDMNAVRRTAAQVMKYCFSIGIFFSFFFHTYGEEIGCIIFHNLDAGIYLELLSWLCPFLYVSASLGGILNGLGDVKMTFLTGFLSSLSRLFLTVFLVPHIAIKGYLWGLLISQLISCFGLLIRIFKMTGDAFSLPDCLVKPVLESSVSILAAVLAKTILQDIMKLNDVLTFLFGAFFSCLIFFTMLLYRSRTTLINYKKINK